MPARQRKAAAVSQHRDGGHRLVHDVEATELVGGPDPPLLPEYGGQRLAKPIGLLDGGRGQPQPFLRVVRTGQQHLPGAGGIQQRLGVAARLRELHRLVDIPVGRLRGSDLAQDRGEL